MSSHRDHFPLCPWLTQRNVHTSDSLRCQWEPDLCFFSLFLSPLLTTSSDSFIQLAGDEGESPHPNLIGASHHSLHSRRAFCNQLTSESLTVCTLMRWRYMCLQICLLGLHAWNLHLIALVIGHSLKCTRKWMICMHIYNWRINQQKAISDPPTQNKYTVNIYSSSQLALSPAFIINNWQARFVSLWWAITLQLIITIELLWS